MKILITGANGQLGYDILRHNERNALFDAVGTDRAETDLTRPEEIVSLFRRERFDAVLHCAAYTAVDIAETERDLCRKVNYEATARLCDETARQGGKFMFLSTDYVFDGTKQGYYGTQDLPNPQNIYGKTKYEAETYVLQYDRSFVVRTSWVFGINGQNFVRSMLRLSQSNTHLKVVSDQIGSPTYTVDLARLLCDMVFTERYGLYHATNEGYCSRSEFAEEIFRQANRSVTVEKVLTSEFPPSAATRPLNAKLDRSELKKRGFLPLPNWKDALQRYLTELREKDLL